MTLHCPGALLVVLGPAERVDKARGLQYPLPKVSAELQASKAMPLQFSTGGILPMGGNLPKVCTLLLENGLLFLQAIPLQGEDKVLEVGIRAWAWVQAGHRAGQGHKTSVAIYYLRSRPTPP